MILSMLLAYGIFVLACAVAVAIAMLIRNRNAAKAARKDAEPKTPAHR
jgi:flagellar basal body-associated protein FliL